MLHSRRVEEAVDGAKEDLPLSTSAQHLLEEARMVLPGLQALFGFQMVAVFSESFDSKLTLGEQKLHLLAIGLAAVAIAMIMTPAAYRQTSPGTVTERFIRVSSRLLLTSMLPLAVSVCIDFYLVGRIIAGSGWAPWLAAALLATFLVLWFVFPRRRSLRAWRQGANRLIFRRATGPKRRSPV